MKNLLVSQIMGKEEIQKVVAMEGVSKSAKIRNLFDGGLEVSEIATLLNIRYNFAFNVLQNYIIMNEIPTSKTDKSNSKRAEIVKLLGEGLSLADVSRATKTNYNYIWKINKELKGESNTTEKTTSTTPSAVPLDTKTKRMVL